MYLSSIYYVPGTVLSPRDIAMTNTDKILPTWRLHSSGGGRQIVNQINKSSARIVRKVRRKIKQERGLGSPVGCSERVSPRRDI